MEFPTKFTENLSKETKSSHTRVDAHNVLKLVGRNERAGQMYIYMNKVCLDAIQKKLKEMGYKNEIFGKLYKNNLTGGECEEWKNNCNRLVDRCEKYPLEHAYMFYLGILYGGSILSKALNNDGLDTTLFEYENKKVLIREFKEFLNEYITDVSRQKQFIECVNMSYASIVKVLDNFEKLL